MKKTLILSSLACGLLFTACKDNNESKENSKQEKETPKETVATQLSLEKTAAGPEFPGATLLIKDLTAKPAEGDSVSVTINYEVKNYELKAQTSDAKDRTCNNSKDGQHIHFILDNAPYAALYAPTHTFKVAKNSEHHLLSFLSRSYHLSLKNKEAYQLVSFKIDDKGNLKKMENPKTPMLFYSRPKGTYVGNDAKEVLLDFYLVNADLAKDSLKIVPVVNGTNMADINEWQPYLLKGLPMGANKIQLNLVKKDGKGLENNPFAAVSREFTLAESEPVQ